MQIRKSLVKELYEQAGFIGDNSSSALAFHDQDAAQEILSVFRHQSHIQQAVLFTADGNVLSQYQPGSPPALVNSSEHAIYQISWQSIEIYRKIFLNNEPVGTIYLFSNLQPVYQRLQDLLSVTILAMMLSSLLALIISSRLQKSILDPLVNLTNVATRISQNQDFSLRAPTHSPDEIGTLIDGFNTMLQEIQDRDHELAEHRSHLSDMVSERTIKLSETNTRLQNEIAERKRIGQQVLDMASDLKIKNEELALSRDAALQAARAKADFLATMSHEIRTPMNGILGMTGLLLETELTPNQYYLGNTVQTSAEALLTLLNDILDLSKIEAGKFELEFIDFDLGATIEDSLDLLAERAERKHLELTGLIFPDVPTSLRGDPGRLRQIVLNLLGNGIKFTDTGEVTIQVLLSEESPTDVELRFHIWDTGTGIAPEIKHKLFQAFSQADSSTTRKYGGTGLGLAICQQLVELMGGEIGVESQPNEWSLFWFSVRLQKQESDQWQEWSSRTDLQGLRVCCIDYNPTNLFLLQTHTQSWGMHTFTTTNPEIGFTALREAAANAEPFDLVIIDRNFPEDDGIQVGLRIKQEASLAKTKLVLLASVGQRSVATDVQKAGFDAYLTKPIRKWHLQNTIATAMGLPSSQAASQTRPLVTSHSINEGQRQSGRKILIADDHAVNQQLMKMLVEKLGFSSDVVSNGQEAVHAVTTGSYALVFMDCQMPDMDGFDATRAIRNQETENRAQLEVSPREQESGCSDSSGSFTLPSLASRVPIIALTANAMPGDREKCLAAGMDDYLSKPIRPEELAAVLERWLPTAHDTPGEVVPLNHEPTHSKNPTQPGHEPSSPINPARLQEWRELGGPDFVAKMVEQFVTDVTDCFHAIKQALDRDDKPALTEAAHGLKGICANFGAAQLQHLALDLEQAGREGKTLNGPQTIEIFRTAITQVTHCLATSPNLPQT